MGNNFLNLSVSTVSGKNENKQKRGRELFTHQKSKEVLEVLQRQFGTFLICIISLWH